MRWNVKQPSFSSPHLNKLMRKWYAILNLIIYVLRFKLNWIFYNEFYNEFIRFSFLQTKPYNFRVNIDHGSVCTETFTVMIANQ